MSWAKLFFGGSLLLNHLFYSSSRPSLISSNKSMINLFNKEAYYYFDHSSYTQAFLNSLLLKILSGNKQQHNMAQDMYSFDNKQSG